MATIKTYNTGAEVRSTFELGDTLWHKFAFGSGAPPRRQHLLGFAPHAGVRATAAPSVVSDEDLEMVLRPYAKTAGQELLVHCEATDTPLQVAIGDSATEGGTFSYSAWVYMNNGDALRAVVDSAWFRLKVRKLNPEASGRATFVHQEVAPVVT